jgi:hypothetical protein
MTRMPLAEDMYMYVRITLNACDEAMGTRQTKERQIPPVGASMEFKSNGISRNGPDGAGVKACLFMRNSESVTLAGCTLPTDSIMTGVLILPNSD